MEGKCSEKAQGEAPRPPAAEKNCYKLGALNQQKIIDIYYLTGPESTNLQWGSLSLQPAVVRAETHLGTLGESVSLARPAAGGGPHALLPPRNRSTFNARDS